MQNTDAACREPGRRLRAERGFSQRRTCTLALIDPKTDSWSPTAVSSAGERCRFGYRRLGVLLHRGCLMSKKKLYRLRKGCPCAGDAAASARPARRVLAVADDFTR